jgi:hypothetical protein
MTEKNSKNKNLNNSKILPVSAIHPRFEIVSTSVTGKHIQENVEKYKSLLLLDGYVDIQIPNQIFSDLLNCSLFSNWQQKAFAYTYYYLISFLYRNCIYSKGVNINDYGLENIKKNFLKISSHKLNHIYTKGGILDQLGYTASQHDIPVEVIIENKKLAKILTVKDAQQSHECDQDSLNTLNHYCFIPSAFSFKVPLRGLFIKPPNNYETLYKEKYKDKKIMRKLEKFNGHFFSFANTHKIQIECFIACMSNSRLGYRAFYLYGLHRMLTDKFKNGHNLLIKQIQKEIPISESTLKIFHRELEAMNLIERKIVRHKASTYKASSHVPVIYI